MQQQDISRVRASVHQQCGRRVLIQLDRGRNKVDIQEGVIQKAYPSVFTILIDDEQEQNPAAFVLLVIQTLLQEIYG